MYKILFFVTALCAIYCEANFIPIIIWDKAFQIPSPQLIRAKRQLFGGMPSFPGARTNQQFGGSIFSTPKHDVSAWGSLSQDRWKPGSRPIIYGGGVDWTAPRGGVSLTGSHTPHQTTLFGAAGSASILKTPDDNVNIFASHTRKLDRGFEPLSISTTGGIAYQRKDVGSLKLSGIHTSGLPNTGPLSLSGSQSPRETTSFTAEGRANIFKTPDHNVNLMGSHTRKHDGNSKLLSSSSTGGVGYEHKSGGTLKLSGIHSSGVPDSGSVSPSGSQVPRETSSFTVEGKANIFKTPDHKVNVEASHTMEYDQNSKPLGSRTTGGVGYEHKSGGTLKLSGIHSGSVSPSGSQVPRETSSFTVEGKANIFKTPDHKVNVEASHTMEYDQNSKPLGSRTTGGVDYQHTSGLSLNLEGTHIPDKPVSGSLTGNLPVFTSEDGDTKVGLQGSLNFLGGKKPSSEVNVLFEKKF